ncbi:hypothetical protein [Novosphingobium resinovorum]|uniref:hypothetical protein n=1 Tax=Novosphingobium resinovorum TaxID=158500 RepID=UPI003D2D06B6
MISIVISMVMTAPMMADVFEAAKQGLSEAEMQKRMFSRLSGMMRTSVWASVASTLVLTGLLSPRSRGGCTIPTSRAGSPG